MKKKLVGVGLLVGALVLSCLSLAWAEETETWLKHYPNFKQYVTLDAYEEATGNKIEKFGEAPMLRTKVASGELPPVEERLPEEPLVISPFEEIGKYGGTLSVISPELNTIDQYCEQAMLALTADDKYLIFNILKSAVMSDDYRTATIEMRKGMKWSDGAPFTTDDFVFWVDDVLGDDELAAMKPLMWAPGGELMTIKKIDDYTAEFQFAVPNPLFPEAMLSLRETGNPQAQLQVGPKHYLQKWHIKYNPDANELAKKEGFDHWWMAFNWHYEQEDAGRPGLAPWLFVKRDMAGNLYKERNPYYWKIDTAGNQLPYADGLNTLVVGDKEVMKLKIMSGEVSFSAFFLGTVDYPLLKENEAMGNYTAVAYEDTLSQPCQLTFNYTHKDPVLRELFNDIRFRQAASLSINREEINQILYYGRAQPHGIPASPTVAFYEEWMRTANTEYNPEKANQLMDEIGLTARDKDGFRLRPDGETLHIVMEPQASRAERKAMAELWGEYFGEIGIKVTVKPAAEALYSQRLLANDMDTGIAGMGGDIWENRRGRCNSWKPPWHWPNGSPIGGTEWYRWYATDGEEGIVPPQEIQDLYDYCDEWLATPMGTERFMELGRKILVTNIEGMWVIGSVGMPPRAATVDNRLGNVPMAREGQRPQVIMPGSAFWMPYRIEQFFFKS